MLFVNFLNSNFVGFRLDFNFKMIIRDKQYFFVSEMGEVPCLLSPSTKEGKFFNQSIVKGFVVRKFQENVCKALGAASLNGETLRMTSFYNSSLLNMVLYAENSTQEFLEISYPIYSKFNYDESQKISGHYCLDRFCLIRRHEDKIILERPLKEFRLYLNSNAAQKLINELMRGADGEKLIAKQPKKFQSAAHFIINFLAHEGLLIKTANKKLPKRIEEGKPHEICWDFHDLVFHGASRSGYEVNFGGGIFPYIGIMEPLPANSLDQKQWQGEEYPLFQPNMNDFIAKDLPMGMVMEMRNTIRQYNEKCPMNAKALGEFLFRVARVKHILTQNVASTTYGVEKNTDMQVTYRPYPSGGASYESDIFITIDRCADLPSGFYFYDPFDHKLIKIHDRNNLVEHTIGYAHISMAKLGRAPVILHLAARFMRVNWKYRNMAYAAIQKNAGVIYSTMYQVATNMGLAPCGLGSGNIKIFAELTGLDPMFQGSVGDFGLGIPEIGTQEGKTEYAKLYIGNLENGIWQRPFNMNKYPQK